MKMRNTIIADRIWNQSVSPMAVRPRMHSPSQTLAPSPPPLSLFQTLSPLESQNLLKPTNLDGMKPFSAIITKYTKNPADACESEVRWGRE